MKTVLQSLSSCERQLDAKRRSFADLRRKVYRTVEKLHNAEGAGEPDAAAAGTRGEKKLEDFLSMLGRNAFSGVAYADLRHFTAASENKAQLSATGHGFAGIEH